MTRLVMLLAGGTLLAGNAVTVAGADRPTRRGTVGLVLRQPQSGAGAEVVRLEIGSPAYESTIRPGDIITLMNGQRVDTVAQVAKALDRVRAGTTWRLRMVRKGRSQSATLTAAAAAMETSTAEVDTEYTWFTTTDRVALRGVISRPAGSGTQWPTILILPGLGGVACDDPAFPLYRTMAHEFVRHGYATVRWDQRGAGDSYGAPYANVDFERETRDAMEILKAVLARRDVDRSRLYVFGYSMGGVVAPNVIAGQDGAAALITWGTLSRPLVEYMIDVARAQGQLAGLGAPEINRQVRLTIRFYERLLAGESPHSLIKQYPQLRDFAHGGTHVQGKTPEFWRQLDSTRYAQIYGNSRVPTLAMYGEHDFIATLLDQTNIVALARAAGRQDVHATQVPGVDHYMNPVSSRAESFERVKNRDYAFNPIGVQAAVQWIAKLEEFRRSPAHQKPEPEVPDEYSDSQRRD